MSVQESKGKVYCLSGNWIQEREVGKRLYESVRLKKSNVIHLDARKLSEIYAEEFDIRDSIEARQISAQRDLDFCLTFAEAGFDVVYTNDNDISFDESWLEQRFNDYSLITKLEDMPSCEPVSNLEIGKGTLYWFTGLSGAGKTTLGTRWYERLRSFKPNVILLDGDKNRARLKNNDYSRAARESKTFAGIKIAKYITDQGIDVVYCVIAMFDSIRNWNRENIENYKEIYLEVPMEVLFARDTKGLYAGARSGKIKDVVGMDQIAEFPKNPDVRILNDGNMNPEDTIEYIASQLVLKEEKSV